MAQVTDPVCAMKIEEGDAVATADHKGKTYYFCSLDCQETFREDPDDYADGN